MSVKKLEVSQVPTAEGINGEMQAFYIALKASGLSVPFTTLMGVGGLAFRIYWHVGSKDDETYGQWSDTSLEAVSGTHPAYTAAQYVGWSYTPYNHNTLDDMYMLARDSIDKGIPAIARGPVGPPLPSIIIGYEEETTRKLLILSKFTGDHVTDLEIPMFDLPLLEYGYWRNPIFILEPGMPPEEDERKEIIKTSLKNAAEAINAPDLDNGRWVGGKNAYDAIAKDLEGDISNVMPGLEPEGEEEDPRVYFMGSFINELARARGCAFEFIETYADDFPVEDAVKEYEVVYNKCTEIKELIPNPDDDYEKAFSSLFSAEARKEVANKLRQMADAEQKASEILKSKISDL